MCSHNLIGTEYSARIRETATFLSPPMHTWHATPFLFFRRCISTCIRKFTRVIPGRTKLSIQLCDPRFNPSKLVQGVGVAWRICEIIGVHSTLYWELFYSPFVRSILSFFFFFLSRIHWYIGIKWNYIDNDYYHRV